MISVTATPPCAYAPSTMRREAPSTPAAMPVRVASRLIFCAKTGRPIFGCFLYITQRLPPDLRTSFSACRRVISDRLLTFLEQCEQKRTTLFPVISSHDSPHGLFTSIASIKLFLDIQISSNSNALTHCLP